MARGIPFCPRLNLVGVGSQLIVTNAVIGRHIGANELAASHFVTGVLGATLTQNKVTAWHVGTDTLTSRHYGSAGITGNHIAPDSIDTSHINTNAVDGVVLAPLAVSSGHVGTQALTLGNATHGVAFGKLNGLYMSVPFGTQGVTMGVTHGLGRAAYGWLMVRNDSDGFVLEKANVATQLRLVATGVAMTDAAVKVVVW